MKKEIRTRTLQEIVDQFAAISFPEYQRESTVWDLDAKQRLLDSIARGFDISTLYYYKHEDSTVLDCIDGRQRLNAIVSFFGVNKTDEEDNGFRYKLKNEVYSDVSPEFDRLEGMTFADIIEAGGSKDRHERDLTSAAVKFRKVVREYRVIEVILSDAAMPEEFNLQFTRLNLGAILNSGEKLHAMVGALRNFCFDKDGIGAHPFLSEAGVTTRRFAKEQTAAQIATQVLSLASGGHLTRTRYLDLQVAFKQYARLDSTAQEALERLRSTLDVLNVAFRSKKALRNRSITVSAVLRAFMAKMDKSEAKLFAAFLVEFLEEVAIQVRKGRNFDAKFEYLLDFQKHLTQASVERPAVEARDETLRAGFEFWKQHRAIQERS